MHVYKNNIDIIWDKFVVFTGIVCFSPRITRESTTVNNGIEAFTKKKVKLVWKRFRIHKKKQVTNKSYQYERKKLGLSKSMEYISNFI